MSYFLEPRAPEVEPQRINGWNLRPTLELLNGAGLLPPEFAEQHEPLTVSLTQEGAEAVAAFLSDRLDAMQPDQRVLLDGSVTSEPDDFALHQDDPGRNYSATYAWLTDLRDFCLVSRGFDIIP